VLRASDLLCNDLAWRCNIAQQVKNFAEVGKEGTTAMAGNLLRRSWLWLNCWLRASVYWFSNLAMGGSIRFRRRLLRAREKKSMLKMGRRIRALHQDNQNDWSGDGKVKEILQVLEESSRKQEKLKSLLHERKDRFREKVRKLKEKGTESEAEEDSAGSNSKS
jgi:hypothetical protein